MKKSKNYTYTAGIALVGVTGMAIAGFICVSQINALHDARTQAAAAAVALATTTPPADSPNAFAHISLIGKAAVVYDLTNGQTLYAQNANAPLPLASITKLLTLYAASSVLSPASSVTMSSSSLSQINDNADAGFTAGETFTYEDIARLTLAASSNSGAEAIAEAARTATGLDTTSLLSNAASKLSLRETHATNSSGLDVDTTISGGYGSAHDIAVLAGALLQKYPDVARATTLPFVSVTSSIGKVHSFANTDIDVTHFPNPLLSKTGYTDLAGGNLVVVYDAAINHPVAIVVLGSTQPGRFSDMQELMAATLAHFAGAAAPGGATSGNSHTP